MPSKYVGRMVKVWLPLQLFCLLITCKKPSAMADYPVDHQRCLVSLDGLYSQYLFEWMCSDNELNQMERKNEMEAEEEKHQDHLVPVADLLPVTKALFTQSGHLFQPPATHHFPPAHVFLRTFHDLFTKCPLSFLPILVTWLPHPPAYFLSFSIHQPDDTPASPHHSFSLYTQQTSLFPWIVCQFCLISATFLWPASMPK